MSKLMAVPISEIRENPVALRAVNRESEEYLGLVDSIKAKGVLNAITVRERDDKESGKKYYELIDGLHRFSASKDAGLKEINATVLTMSDDEVLEAQVMANIHKIETKPADYSKQLIRILSRNPLMTEAELATKLGKSASWIGDRLSLNKISNPVIRQLVNDGKIKLANAYALAKLPPEEMADFVDRAQTLGPDEFVPQVQTRVKEIRDAKRAGKDASPQEFQPVAYLQKIGDIKTENDSGAVGKTLVKTTGAKTAEQGFALGIQWALHLDIKSIEVQKAKDEERRKERDDVKKKKAAEKADKAAKDAAEKAEEAKKAAAELSA